MGSHKRTWWQSCGAVIMILGCTLAPASAHAQDEVQVSPDAQHWQPDLDQPLFDPDRSWVPGDEQTTNLWIRNTADNAGNLRLAVDPTDHDQLLRNGLQLRFRTPDSGWIALASDGSAREVSRRLPAGATTRLWIAASFDAAAGNVSQERRVDLRLRVTLSQLIDDGEAEPPGSMTPGPDDLAGTGLDVSPIIVFVGAIAIGAGAALVRRPRGQDRGHHRD